MSGAEWFALICLILLPAIMLAPVIDALLTQLRHDNQESDDE